MVSPGMFIMFMYCVSDGLCFYCGVCVNSVLCDVCSVAVWAYLIVWCTYVISSPPSPCLALEECSVWLLGSCVCVKILSLDRTCMLLVCKSVLIILCVSKFCFLSERVCYWCTKSVVIILFAFSCYTGISCSMSCELWCVLCYWERMWGVGGGVWFLRGNCVWCVSVWSIVGGPEWRCSLQCSCLVCWRYRVQFPADSTQICRSHLHCARGVDCNSIAGKGRQQLVTTHSATSVMVKVKSSMASSLPVENLLPQNVGSTINYLQ